MIKRDGAVFLVNPGATATAYTSGYQLGTLQKLSNVVLDTKGIAFLRTLVVLDKAIQKKACDILFFNSVVTLAADNAAFTLSDADLESFIGMVSVADADYVTLEASNNAVAVKQIEMLLPAAQGVKDIWMAVISRGTPTYTANCLKIKAIVERI